MGKRSGGGVSAGAGQGSAKIPKGDENTLLKKNKFAPLADGKEPTEPVEKRVKFPPIFTPVKDVGKLMTALGKEKLHPNYKLCSTGTKILCCNEDLFNKVKAFLKQANMEFYTHDVAATKPMKVVIRGLPARVDPKLIDDELVKVHKLKTVAVFEMSRRNKEVNYRDSLYLVHLERGSTTLAELRKIRAIAHIVVDWEIYRPQHRDVTQCKNCQGFGHGTKNCAMAPKCPKCAGSHAEEDCEPEMEDDTAKCVNCGGEHLASDKTCPKRAEFILIRKKASTRNQPNQTKRNKKLSVDDENFPLLTPPIPNLEPLPPRVPKPRPKPIPPGPKPTPPGWGNQGDRQQQQEPEEELYTPEELMNIIMEMSATLRTCRTRRDQFTAITKFFIQYGY